MSKNDNKKPSNGLTMNARRRAVRNLLSGAGTVVVGGQLASKSWIKPVVDTIVIPAHAETTNGTPPPASNTLAGRIGSEVTGSALDYFISASYAAVGNLAGGCISFDFNGDMVNVKITYKNGTTGENTGSLEGGNDFCIDVDGNTVSGVVDNRISPNSASGTIEGSSDEDYTAIKGASCIVVPPVTTTCRPNPSGSGTQCP